MKHFKKQAPKQEALLTEFQHKRYVIGTVNKHRTDYIAAIRHADTGEYDSLRELHRQSLEVPTGWIASAESGGRRPPRQQRRDSQTTMPLLPPEDDPSQGGRR